MRGGSFSFFLFLWPCTVFLYENNYRGLNVNDSLLDGTINKIAVTFHQDHFLVADMLIASSLSHACIFFTPVLYLSLSYYATPLDELFYWENFCIFCY
jgi:hypothetical protein